MYIIVLFPSINNSICSFVLQQITLFLSVNFSQQDNYVHLSLVWFVKNSCAEQDNIENSKRLMNTSHEHISSCECNAVKLRLPIETSHLKCKFN